MRIVFLDIDGVLSTFREVCHRLAPGEKRIRPYAFSPKAIQTLNDIYLASNCSLVISSSWRKIYSLDDLRDLFRERKILAPIIDKTDGIGPRGIEIIAWLSEHKEVTDYIILEDEVFDMKELRYRVVHPIPKYYGHGLYNIHLKGALRLFGIEQ